MTSGECNLNETNKTLKEPIKLVKDSSHKLLTDERLILSNIKSMTKNQSALNLSNNVS
jgi:hypothetical protein